MQCTRLSDMGVALLLAVARACSCFATAVTVHGVQIKDIVAFLRCKSVSTKDIGPFLKVIPQSDSHKR